MSKTVKEKSKLKKLAQSAKERLKSGYWSEVKVERERAKESAESNGHCAGSVNDYYKEKFTREIKANINKINQSDEVLYKKVCQILDSDEDIVNPVNSLIDREKYEGMDFASRQRYVFMLMSKYSEMKERYYKEKAFAYAD